MIDVPETLHSQSERGRLHAQGSRTDDRSHCTLLVIHEADGSWAIRGLGAPGVRLSKAEMIALAETISGGCPVTGPCPVTGQKAGTGAAPRTHRYPARTSIGRSGSWTPGRAWST